MTGAITYEERDLSSIVPDPDNPRTITDAAMKSLASSVRRFGLVQPIVINRTTGHVVGGHQRLLALQKLGHATAAVAVGEWTVAEERALNVTLNNPAVQGSFLGVDRYLETALQGLSAEDFRELSLDTLMPLEAKPAGDDPDDEIPEPPKGPPVTQPGDVWQLGDHVLFCGDCRGDLSAVMAGRTINVAVTSPPYASQRKYDPSSGFVPIAPDAYVAWFEAVQANVARYLAADGSWFVNIRANVIDGERHLYVHDLLLAHARQWDWKFIDDFCWRNTGDGFPGGWPNRFKNAWEPVFHFARATAIKHRPRQVAVASDDAFAYSPTLNKRLRAQGSQNDGEKARGDGLSLPSNVIEACAARSGHGEHTAPFPVALPSFFIAAFSDEGDTIFDPFCGSGTTLVAAERIGRRCIAVELSPAYCDVIVERWQTLTGSTATRATTGRKTK